MNGAMEFEAALAAANLPGAVALVTDSTGTRYLRAFGMADAVAGVPMREDTLFQIASMTKALTSTAALQLVERGQLDLDAPIGAILPDLADLPVLEGFDEAGQPVLRARGPVTLRHLLLHTAGCGYTFMDETLLRCAKAGPKTAPGSREACACRCCSIPARNGSTAPAPTGWALPSRRFQAWPAGLVRSRTDRPAGHDGNAFSRRSSRQRIAGPCPRQRERVRDGADGAGRRQLPERRRRPFLDGNRLCAVPAHGAARRRAGRRARGLAGNGAADARGRAARVAIRRGADQRPAPARHAFDPLPGQRGGWTLGGFLVNTETGPAGRSPGSLHWAGILNCYYWIDPARDMAGVILAQLAPFADPGALSAFAALERMACAQ
jgi:CubicO group peptidase (beta-lactamase class C family)